MNIDTNYILGIADATLDMWQETNGTIDSEKEVSFFTEPIINNNKQSVAIGCRLYVNYKDGNWEDNDKSTDFNIYSKDKISGVISDISDILSSIDSFEFNEKDGKEF